MANGEIVWTAAGIVSAAGAPGGGGRYGDARGTVGRVLARQLLGRQRTLSHVPPTARHAPGGVRGGARGVGAPRHVPDSAVAADSRAGGEHRRHTRALLGPVDLAAAPLRLRLPG